MISLDVTLANRSIQKAKSGHEINPIIKDKTNIVKKIRIDDEEFIQFLIGDVNRYGFSILIFDCLIYFRNILHLIYPSK